MENDNRECDINNSIVIENVRITPKSLIFCNPVEGQEYKAKIVLQNVGKDAVSVRILHASSSNVVFQPIINSQFLSSGLKIICEIKYKVVMATLISTCSIPIYVNASKYLFQITVQEHKTPLRSEPQYLDFGVIDTGPSPVRRRLTFYNDGAQPEHFHIDLGPNELNMMIEPMKGIILAKSSMEVRIDLTILKEGTYTSEFWIISNVPMCMQLTVTARHGHIETQARFNMKSFKFLHFPITYYGLSSRKILLLKNASQIQSIFCITGVKQMNIFNFVDAPNIDTDYNQFRVQPKEGRLFENDVRMFTFTFEPQKKYAKEDGYHLVMMRINKVFCRDLNPDDYDGEIFERLIRVSSTVSRGTINMEGTTFDDYVDEEEVEEHAYASTGNEQNRYVNVMLYGSAESPNVIITPNELTLRNLDVKVPAKRVLNFQNCSKHLPITLRYNKIAFVAIEPPEITIAARRSIDVTVIITAQSYHPINTTIQFDLLHYDQPRKNNLLQKIGEMIVPISIHQRVVTAPGKSKEILAKDYTFPKGTPQPRKDIYQQLLKENPILGLPDDRPRALRRWKSAVACKTIYAGLPRVCNRSNEFELTAKQIALQQDAKDYYRNFIRNYAMKCPLVKQTDLELLHKNTIVCVPTTTSSNVNEPERECANFIPLTPQQLLNITIEPRNYFIDRIVPKSWLKILLVVKNDNLVELRLFLKPQKQQYYRMTEGTRFIVQKKQSIKLGYYIHAHLIGQQSYRLDIIVNECHVFETTVTANIVQAQLQITPSELEFTERDYQYKFIEFHNKLNEDVSFEWISTDDFILDPMEGVVHSRNRLACLIGINPHKVQSNPYGTYELMIKIGGKHLSYRIKVNKGSIDFLFTEHVNFGVIAIGVPTSRYLPVQNCCKQAVTFRCTSYGWIPNGIDIEPREGVLIPNVVQWLKVTANLSAELMFDCQLGIHFGDARARYLTIRGIGIFPKLLIDEQLLFRKIAASGFDIKKFSLRNTSPVPAQVTFSVERLSELYISEHEESRYFMKNNCQSIKPYTGTCFYIHYYPSYPEIKNFHLPMSVNGVHNMAVKKDKEIEGLVPRLRIYTNTFPHKLHIKSWSYFFHYYDNDKHATVNEHTITLAATPFAPLRLCLRLDQLRLPFELCDAQGGKIIKQDDFAIVVELSSQMSPFTFKMRFRPHEYRRYEMRIPVFIKDDYNEDVHNYLYFNGTYYQPTFIFPDDPIYFGYIPLDFKIVKFVKIKLKYHRPRCFLTLDCDNANVTLTCENNGKNEHHRNIKILYYCNNINIMDSFLNVQCMCGGFCQISMIGGAENTYLTVYNCVEYLRIKYDVDVYNQQPTQSETEAVMRSRSVSQVNFELPEVVEYVYKSEFPFFPTGDNPFANYFNRVINVVEAWVCQQGFFGAKHYTIPHGMSRYEICESRTEKKRIALPFCTFFCNLCTISEDLFDLYCDQETNHQHHIAIYNFYTEVLEILQTLGGMVNHIKPESLFPYESYLTHFKKQKSSLKFYTPDRFHMWSKQSWLHLILQTYKVFVLKRLIKVNPSERREYNLIRTIRSMHNMNSGPSLFEVPVASTSNLFQTELNYIISWVNTDYNMTKVTFTGENFINRKELPRRDIKFFNRDFADGIVLAAITLTYCPYLAEYFYKLYLPPKTPQQYFYNAYLLIKVWDMLNISLHLKPNDITDANPIMLIFLLTYLYDFLTHFKPRKEIQLSAELTKTHSVEVMVVNENKLPINYELTIFNDPEKLFKVNTSRIHVPKSRIVRMNVYYTARFIKSNRAVLVLKGEIASGSVGKYTHGQAFLLEGTTLIGPPSLEIILHGDIYTMCQKNLEFHAPYPEDCEYELFLTYEKPVDLNNLKLMPVKSLISTHTLGRLQIETPYLVSLNRKIQKQVRMCSITLSPLYLWIFARHPHIGDFYLKMECYVQPRYNLITIVLQVPKDVFNNPCICNGKPAFETKCPRIFMLKVPCKNESMWKGLLKYFFKYRDEDEYYFWNYYKDTPVGLHVLKRLLFDHQKYLTSDMSYIFEPRFSFEVKNYNKSVYMEKKLEVENTLAVGQHTHILIHLNEFLTSFPFELHNPKEKRCYNVIIDKI